MGSWLLGSPLKTPGVCTGLGLARPRRLPAKRKTWGVGNSPVVQSRHAVIGRRGSLVPRRFDTSESRGQGGSHGWFRALVVRWPRAAGRQGPYGAALEQCPQSAPMLKWGHSAYCLFGRNKRNSCSAPRRCNVYRFKPPTHASAIATLCGYSTGQSACP